MSRHSFSDIPSGIQRKRFLLIQIGCHRALNAGIDRLFVACLFNSFSVGGLVFHFTLLSF